MDEEAPGPEIHYYMIRGGSEKTNITVWQSGRVGDEYIKAYGHYHVGNITETYKILQGVGILLLQKRKADENGKPINDEIETFHAIRMKSGDELFIPSNIGHSLVNVGSVWLATSDDSPVNFGDADPVSLPGHADYESVKVMKGFAYYVVEKNGAPVLIPNSNYKSMPPAEIISLEEYRKL